jgi:hypothetical protein
VTRSCIDAKSHFGNRRAAKHRPFPPAARAARGNVDARDGNDVVDGSPGEQP